MQVPSTQFYESSSGKRAGTPGRADGAKFITNPTDTLRDLYKAPN